MAADAFDEMDRLFEQLRRSLGPFEGRFGFGEDLAMDLSRRDDEYVLVADVPGFERDEFDLTLEDGALVVEATHELREGELARERRVFERVSVPAGVDASSVTATYRNGVLEVHLPLSAERSGRRIDVE